MSSHMFCHYVVNNINKHHWTIIIIIIIGFSVTCSSNFCLVHPTYLSRFLSLSVDFTRSKLNVLTWRENYAGSSGLSSLKRSTDSVNTRIADGVTVRNFYPDIKCISLIYIQGVLHMWKMVQDHFGCMGIP